MTSNPNHSRRGAALITVIAFFAIALTMFAVWTKGILSYHRRVQFHHQQVQADWLLEAGIRRAAARLSADNSYTGEEWQIEVDASEGNQSALIELMIEPSKQAEVQPTYEITAAVIYPQQSRRQVRKHITMAYTPKTQGTER